MGARAVRLGALGILLAGIVGGVLPGAAQGSLAAFSASGDASGAVDVQTLDPPTGLAATAAARVTLAWAPSVDPWAAGYAVFRTSTPGSGHVLVGTVTPGTATTATDDPGAGTFGYVLRSTFASWSSVDSNESVVTLAGPVTTPYASCVSNAADTTGAGDNNGYQSNPARACVDNTQYAADANSGSGSGGAASASCGSGATPSATEDRHRFWGFAHGVPATASAILGIEVRADAGLNNSSGTNNLCVQLSWNGGTTWTAIRSLTVSSASETTYLYGGAGDTWGRTWSPSELASTALRVRVINASSATNREFRLYWLSARVTYRP